MNVIMDTKTFAIDGFYPCPYGGYVPLVEKGLPFVPLAPNQIRSAAKGSISLGSFENVGKGALVPVQMGPSVPVSTTNRD
jgi:hypothetical protein